MNIALTRRLAASAAAAALTFGVAACGDDDADDVGEVGEDVVDADVGEAGDDAGDVGGNEGGGILGEDADVGPADTTDDGAGPGVAGD